jgi:hypothetical protein
MTGNDAAGLIDQDCGGESPFLDRGSDLGDLFFGMGARVLGVGDELVDGPLLDLVGGVV